MSKSKIYNIWIGMRSRCNSNKNVEYKNYGGRGIRISDEWNSFEQFYLDMGDVPQGMTLDRIDNNLGYSKENCRWATSLEQSRNMRTNRFIEYKGISMILPDWAWFLGIAEWTLRKNLSSSKWTIEKAIEESLIASGRLHEAIVIE